MFPGHVGWRLYGGGSYGKQGITNAAEQDRPDVAAARKALRKEQLTLDPTQVIFIDGGGSSLTR